MAVSFFLRPPYNQRFKQRVFWFPVVYEVMGSQMEAKTRGRYQELIHEG